MAAPKGKVKPKAKVKSRAKPKPKVKAKPKAKTVDGRRGNQFWKLRSKHGRDKLFETPELLWEAASEYFQWCDKHPLHGADALRSGQNAGKIIKIPYMRAYTLTGLCLYVNASEKWWINFRSGDKLSKDFLSVITRIEDIIKTQKFEGAAAGLLNANIIARDLGLSDKQDVKHDFPGIKPIVWVDGND